MKSIQGRLTLILVATVLILVACADALLYAYASSRLTAEFDRAMFVKAQMVSGMIAVGKSGQLEFDGPDVNLVEFREKGHHEYFEIRKSDESVFARSPSLEERDLAQVNMTGIEGARDIVLPDGSKGRALGFAFKAHREDEEGLVNPADKGRRPPVMASVVLALGRGELDTTLRVLASSLLGSALVIACGTIAAVTVGVRRGLKPLNRLGKEADAFSAESLSGRFSTAGLPMELRPICQRLNSLLERLDAAFARERRFTSDVAHELRTPIAELRSLAEVAIKWPEDGAADQNSRDTLDIARRMETTVSALLAISRCDAGIEPVDLRRLDLSKVLSESWRSYEKAARERGLSMEWEVGESASVEADQTMLLGLLGNVFDNAIAYAPAGGNMACRVLRNSGGVELKIANSCDGLTEEDVTRLFDRFWRKDAARTGSAHCGLGLSLVSVYAAAMGARVTAGLPAAGMFEIAVKFPNGSGTHAGGK